MENGPGNGLKNRMEELATTGGERKLQMDPEHFRQAAEVARLAVELSKANGGQPRSNLTEAWELIKQAREIIVAPTLSARELRAKRVEDTLNEAAKAGGTRDAMVKHIEARLAAARIDSADLTGEPGETGQPEIDIWNLRWVDEETGWLAEKPENTKWKRVTLEAFRELLGRYAESKYPEDKKEAKKCVKQILDELKHEGSLSDSLVWGLLQFRQGALSERNRKAAETRERRKVEAKHGEGTSTGI
ncbi:MAG: hypothetical protein ABSE62_08645 [Chthoniobacteraceae bacterium]